MTGLGDHLWQSTLCVLLAALVVRLVGAGHPGLRHHIWLAASVKFLVPFAVLVAAGRELARGTMPALAVPFVPPGLQTFSQPFAVWVEASVQETPPGLESFMPMALVALWLAGSVLTLGSRWTRWREIVRTAAAAPVLTSGREVDGLGRALERSAVSRPVAIHESPALVEPGLVGIRRLILLWPAGLSQHLGDAEIDAIVTHEVCHVQRRDNLTALVHIVVETVFWFHPAVWWIGRQLIHERERACDQDVLALGTSPRTYADGLLNVCRFCLRSPVPFVAGIAGSHLGQRVEAIMTYRARPSLSSARGVLVAAVALLVAGGPVAVGLIAAQPDDAPSGSQDAESASDIRLTRAVQIAAGARTVTRATRQVGVSRRASAATPVSAARGSAATSVEPQSAGAVTIQTPYERVVRLGTAGAAGVGNPIVLKEVKPVYTPEAMREKIQGKVVLEAVVLADGTVGEVSVLKSLDTTYGLDEAAIAAARQWLFKPATRGGVPVSIIVTLELGFRLSDEPQADDFGAGAYHIDTPGLVAPRLLHRVNPNYTPEAMRRKLQGQAMVVAVVNADGTVGPARIVRSVDKESGLDDEATLAIRKWRFAPATLDGRPVPVIVTTTLEFRLH